MKRFFTWLPIFFLLTAMKDKPAFQLFTAEGKSTSMEKMMPELAKADVVLFGEMHNDSITHWLQKKVAEELYHVHGSRLILGAEMFETDVQMVIDEYLGDQIQEKNFTAEARPWNNYKSDYRPLLTFAKDKKLRFIATNVPRRYAAAVAFSGPEKLNDFSPEARNLMAPLPLKVDYDLPGYKNMLSMFGGSHGSDDKGRQMVAAQALKDATMAHFILKNLPAGGKMLHFNGSYHSDNFEGIYWYLKQARPDLKIMTISTVEQDDVNKLDKDNRKKADFILAVPKNSPKSY